MLVLFSSRLFFFFLLLDYSQSFATLAKHWFVDVNDTFIDTAGFSKLAGKTRGKTPAVRRSPPANIFCRSFHHELNASSLMSRSPCFIGTLLSLLFSIVSPQAVSKAFLQLIGAHETKLKHCHTSDMCQLMLVVN